MELNDFNFDRLLLEETGYSAYVVDMDTYDLLYMNKQCMEMCGYKEPTDYQGLKCYETVGLSEPCSFCTNGKPEEQQQYRWEHYNEYLDRWLDVTYNIVVQDGRRLRVEMAKDITARKKASLEGVPLSGKLSQEDIMFCCLHYFANEPGFEAAIRRFLEALGGYYQANRAYIFEFDWTREVMNNTFEWCKPGITAEIGNLQEIPIRDAARWIEIFENEGEFSISSLDEEVDSQSEEYRILAAQGIHSLMAAPMIHGDQIVGMIGVDDPRKNRGDLLLLRSISQFVLAEMEKSRMVFDLERLSFRDSLTGLWNRNHYNRRIREHVGNVPESLGVVLVSINGIKAANDAYGREHGDQMICHIASIAKQEASGDVFRIGGDEFAVLDTVISRNDFQKEVSALRMAFDAYDECSVSMGVVWRETEVDIEEQLRQAEDLMYAEKQTYYSSVLQQGRAGGRIGAAREVIREIEENRFHVYYQPQVELRSGKITGAEALVRKVEEDGTIVSPGTFIPFYETAGVIRYVDLFVLDAACRAVSAWRKQRDDFDVSVNFSRITLMEPEIVEIIREICDRWNVPPSTITIEVTESINKMDQERLRTLIRDLAEVGFAISLDDFGSSYSNLAILSEVDFNEIKFDRSLVQNIENNRKSRAIMRHTIQMCLSLKDVYTVAEGIENREQLKMLEAFDCDYGQGYYFSRPVPEAAFTELLKGSFAL